MDLEAAIAFDHTVLNMLTAVPKMQGKRIQEEELTLLRKGTAEEDESAYTGHATHLNHFVDHL